MFDQTIVVYLYLFFSTMIIAFQFSLIFGAPWGDITMGGRYSGQIPLYMRMVILFVFIPILLLVTMIVLVRSGLTCEEYYEWSKSAIWFVVAFHMIVSILNIITPSKKERMLWAPITVITLGCVIYIAMN